MITFSVKNFERFQHYKDRSPPWIKLYNELLDDYAFSTLSDASKWHLVAIWLLASRTENKIPYDPMWIAARINAKNRVDLDALEKAGFIIVNQDAPQHTDGVEQDASKPLEQRQRERERQRQSRAETERAGEKYTEDFERFWTTYPRLEGNPKAPAFAEWQKAIKAGEDPAVLIAAAGRYAVACAKPDAPKVAHARTWLHQKRWEVWRDAPKPVSAVPAKSERDIWCDRLDAYVPGGRWLWGARPESGYCDAPEDLLTEWKRRQEQAA